MTINLTDPANHPANSPLTVQRIERVIEALESSLKYRNGSSMDNVLVDAMKGLRELREGREQQPVARRMRYKDGPWLYKQIGDNGQAEGCYTEQMLYREPVAAPRTIPTQSSNDVNDAAWKLHDMLTEHGPLNGYQFNNLKECFYEALKVAMRNSPAAPDGWIPVSERMPETDGNYWGWWSESKRQGPVWFIKSDLQAQFQSSEITHWQPLPAAPKEVG